jgi:hypothetical protein
MHCSALFAILRHRKFPSVINLANPQCNRGNVMGARFRLWWQQIKQHPVATILIALLAVIIILIIQSILGYIFNWGWTGLNATDFTSTPPKITRTIAYQPGKTLWDWLQLLIIPAVQALENLSQVSQFACALPGLQGFLSSPKLIELEWPHDFCSLSLSHPPFPSFSIIQSALTSQAKPNARSAINSSQKSG